MRRDKPPDPPTQGTLSQSQKQGMLSQGMLSQSKAQGMLSQGMAGSFDPPPSQGMAGSLKQPPSQTQGMAGSFKLLPSGPLPNCLEAVDVDSIFENDNDLTTQEEFSLVTENILWTEYTEEESENAGIWNSEIIGASLCLT